MTDLDPDALPTVDAGDLALVDRLWRSGTSATAISPTARHDLGTLQRFLSLDDLSVVTPLLRRHRVATWRLATAITLDVDTAAAVVEDAWDEILSGKGELGGSWTNPRAWISEVVRRHGLRHGAALGTEVSVDADITTFPLDQTGDVGLVAASFCLLDEVARTAVWLHAVDGLDDVDIAFVLGLPRLVTHELINDAMADLRAGALRAQRRAAPVSCRPTISSFALYLDHELDDDAEAEMVEHLGACRRCAARLDALEVPGLSLVDRVQTPPLALIERLHDAVAHAA